MVVNSLPTKYWVTFLALLLSADFFLQNQLLPKNTLGISPVQNSLDPVQARHFIWPYLGPNCLQRLLADDTSRQRVKWLGWSIC